MDEPFLMTAEEARKKIGLGENVMAQKIWCEIVNNINQAIDDGVMSYYGEGSLPASVVSKLTAKGYQVRTGVQYNQSYYVISW